MRPFVHKIDESKSETKNDKTFGVPLCVLYYCVSFFIAYFFFLFLLRLTSTGALQMQLSLCICLSSCIWNWIAWKEGNGWKSSPLARSFFLLAGESDCFTFRVNYLSCFHSYSCQSRRKNESEREVNLLLLNLLEDILLIQNINTHKHAPLGQEKRERERRVHTVGETGRLNRVGDEWVSEGGWKCFSSRETRDTEGQGERERWSKASGQEGKLINAARVQVYFVNVQLSDETNYSTVDGITTITHSGGGEGGRGTRRETAAEEGKSCCRRQLHARWVRIIK